MTNSTPESGNTSEITDPPDAAQASASQTSAAQTSAAQSPACEYVWITAENVEQHQELFRAVLAQYNASETATWGESAHLISYEDAHVELTQNKDMKAEYLAALDPESGALLASGLLLLPMREEQHKVYPGIVVDEAVRHRGLGRQLAAKIRERSRELGRTHMDVWSDHTNSSLVPPADLPAGSSVLASPAAAEDAEGVAVPETSWKLLAAAPNVDFCLKQGLAPGLMERVSQVRLHGNPVVEKFIAETSFDLPGGYELLTYEDFTPEHLLKPLGVMLSDFNEDNPAGEMEWERAEMTPERLREGEQRNVGKGQKSLTSLIVHTPSGEVAGISGLGQSAEQPKRLQQRITMVARGHRGHGFGRILKAANARAAQQVFQGAEYIVTDNSDHNAHMLKTNIAMGFEQIGAFVGWKGEV